MCPLELQQVGFFGGFGPAGNALPRCCHRPGTLARHHVGAPGGRGDIPRGRGGAAGKRGTRLGSLLVALGPTAATCAWRWGRGAGVVRGGGGVGWRHSRGLSSRPRPGQVVDPVEQFQEPGDDPLVPVLVLGPEAFVGGHERRAPAADLHVHVDGAVVEPGVWWGGSAPVGVEVVGHAPTALSYARTALPRSDRRSLLYPVMPIRSPAL